MRISMFIAAAAAAAAISGSAQACESLQEAMVRFGEVKDDYVKIAPTMKPADFTVWTTHLKTFGDSMGKMDYPGACAALDAAANELGFASSSESQFPITDSGKSGGKSGGLTASTTDTASETATDAAAATTTDAAAATTTGPAVAEVTDESTVENTTAAQPAGVPGVWQECPRGRCRN